MGFTSTARKRSEPVLFSPSETMHTADMRFGLTLLPLMLFACSPDAVPQPKMVSGSLQRVGGPSPGAAVPLAGQVVFTSGQSTHKVEVDDSGQFSLRLPPATYEVTGSGAGGDCGHQSFRVSGDKGADPVVVSCLVP